jgi:hypothetical protein
MKPVMGKYLDSADAGAIAACLREWRQLGPDLGVLALASEHEPDAVAALQQAANELGVPLAGAVVPGLIAGGSFRRQGVLLLALDAAKPQMIVPLARGGEHTDDAAVAELAAFVEAHAGEDDDDTLLLFVDGMTPDVSSLLDRLYLTVGNRVRYAGSNVGSESFRPVPCLFDNARFVGGAALAHRYGEAASLSVATSSRGNRVASIDGLPAFEAYRELIARAHGVALTRENFYQHVVHFPLALHLAEGEPLVRIPVAVDDDGSLYCVGEVPEAALLSIVEAAPPGSAETARAVAAGVRAHHPAAVLAFACAGRLLHQGEAAATMELAELQAALAPAPVFGALSLGEIANYEGQGYPRFHNATLVALPWR